MSILERHIADLSATCDANAKRLRSLLRETIETLDLLQEELDALDRLTRYHLAKE